MRGRSAERTGGWDRGGLNDDGGGDGDGDANAMARHQKRVAYEEKINYAQVMGEVLLKYFQRWPR